MKNRNAIAFVFVALMAIVAACNKDPQPGQNTDNPTQTDTIPTNDTTTITPPVTPVKPYDTIYLRWKVYPDWTPYEDSVRAHLKPGLVRLTIHVYGENGIGRPINATNWLPSNFSKVQQGLQQIMNADSTRTGLDGLVDVNKIGPAGYEPGPYEYGTMPYDVAQYLMNHNLRIVPNSKQH